MNRAVFFDRDGVINNVLFRDGRPASPRSFEEFELSEGIRPAIARLRAAGFLNIVVTNQPDIARNLMLEEHLNRMHRFIKSRLAVDDIIVCCHDDGDDCRCRKPKPGMLLEAAEKWRIDLNKSFIIGDGWKDIEAGRAAGCCTILLQSRYNRQANPDYRVDSLNSAVKMVLNKEAEDNGLLHTEVLERGRADY